jgi:hypothetical protein
MLQSEFKVVIKDANYFLGLQIDRKPDGSIKVHQSAYLEKVLVKFGMEGCTPLSTPIIKDGEPEAKEELETRFPYREAVGALMYLMVGTRPDIAFAVGVVSRTLENPSPRDWNKVKRIMRYLRGSSTLGLTYKPNKEHNNLEVFTDADYAGDMKTALSTTGVVCMFAGAAITWFSQRQRGISLSTTQSEIVAASEGARELVWLIRLYDGLVGQREPPTIFIDNEAALKLAHNPEMHKRTKHIAIRHFFIRELVIEGEIEVSRVTTESNIADIFTKALPKPRMCKLRNMMGLK